jgi:hypothetical protein
MDWEFPTNISGQPISPIFKGREIQKRELGVSEVFCQFFFGGGGTVSFSNFLKKHYILEASPFFVFMERST